MMGKKDMKLSRKLMMVSVAALMGISPVMATAATNVNTVQAATKSPVYKTKGASRVTVKKTMHFVNRNGKKTAKKAYKNGKYKIWLVTRINGKLYYGIETDGKYWVPASDTKGKVSYSTHKKAIHKKAAKKTSKKVVKKTNKKAAKKVAKKNTKKVSKKTAKKTNSKKTAKKVSPTRLVTLRRTSVYGKNGKKVKTYMGSKKWTTIAKGVHLMTRGSKTINGTKYYALDASHYVLASDVKAR